MLSLLLHPHNQCSEPQRRPDNSTSAIGCWERPSRKVCKSDYKRGPSQAAPPDQARSVRSFGQAREHGWGQLRRFPGAPCLALHPLRTHTHLQGCERSPGTRGRAQRPDAAARSDAVIRTPAPKTSLPSPTTPPAPALGGGGASRAPPSRSADRAGRASAGGGASLCSRGQAWRSG